MLREHFEVKVNHPARDIASNGARVAHLSRKVRAAERTDAPFTMRPDEPRIRHLEGRLVFIPGVTQNQGRTTSNEADE